MAEDCESSSSMKTPMVTVPAPAPAVSSGTDQDDAAFDEDACSICLEPFSSEDPATVTTCKHEYHLQCILEWLQRSKECPICWQSLVLKDPANQELLQAVEFERNSRSRQRSSNTIRFARVPAEDYDFDHVAPYEDDSDVDENIMQQLAAAAVSRAHHLSRRQRHRALGLDPSQFHAFDAPSHGSSAQHTYETVSTESPILGNSTPESTSPSTAMPPERSDQLPSSAHPSLANTGSDTNENRVLANQMPPRSPRRSRPSELFSFSESFKSKFSAASAKYKESISKGTRGFKEKLLARNNSVKELSKEVQREVTAGIASVARMMERLDPTSKRTGSSSSVSHSAEGTSCITRDGKDVQGSLLIQFPSRIHADASHGTHPNSLIHVSGTLSSVPNRVEVTRLQDVLSCHEDQI